MKKRMMAGILALVLTLVCGLVSAEETGCSQVTEQEETKITLQIGSSILIRNGEERPLDVPAMLIDSRTMVPFRAICEALGGTVEWDDPTQTVTVVKGDTTLVLQIGNQIMKKNGKNKVLDVPAQLVEERTLVPARAVAEGLGAIVDWDDPTQTVTITQPVWYLENCK